MALKDIFKKKQEDQAAPKKKETTKAPASGHEAKPEKEQTTQAKKNEKVTAKGARPGVLQAPRVTEKTTMLGEQHQYTFQVASAANKTEVKKAIEAKYGVKVMRVRMIRVIRKERRRGRKIGWTKAYKKAMVSVQKGQSIEVLPR